MDTRFMNNRSLNAAVGLVALAAVILPAQAASQDLARRVAAVDQGTVRLTFPARPGVEICDQGIHWGRHNFNWRSNSWDREPQNCRSGPVEVELQLRGGAVRDVEVIRRERDRTDGAVDIGVVPAREAADFLLDVARGGEGSRGEEDALFPAVLADVEDLWEELLVLAKDRELDSDVRSSALFWVGQEAAEVVTEGLADVAMDEDEEQDVREAAVFALSQRPDEEGVPILMQVARTARDAGTRESAMFWLAESKDERVYAFFEEILVGRRGG